MDNYLVVKIGGRPASNQTVLDALITDIGALNAKRHPDKRLIPVLVHGGGADVTELSKRLGLEPTFVGGKRMTSPAEMQIVEAVLAGNVNTRILRRCLAQKIRAIGLSGVDAGLFTAQSIDSAADNRTGSISTTDVQVIRDLGAAGYVSVVSSVSCDPKGESGLNINADDAAMALAIALQAQCLIFLSDIPGILKDGTVLNKVTPSIAEAEIAAGVISGGMIPKVRSSLGALQSGIRSVVIGGFQEQGDLQGFITGRLGTSMVD